MVAEGPLVWFCTWSQQNLLRRQIKERRYSCHTSR